MKKNLLLSLVSFAFLLFTFSFTTGCGVYSFVDVSIPDSIKTVRVNFIDNRAPYVNPQLSPNLTERIRQKIVNQTRLTQTNKDNAHYDITGTITDYSVSTSGISDKREVTNNLNIAVQIVVNNQLSNTKQEFVINRSFPFSATLSLQQAENQLQDELIRGLTDDIFNRMFSNW